MLNLRDLLPSVLLIAALTVMSRVLGLARDTIIAHEFGASAEYDAFLIAFLIPHLLRMLLAEGALSTALIPLLSEYLAKGREHAARFASNVLTLALIVLPPLVIAGVALAPYYVGFLADGFTAAKQALTVQLVTFTFPFILLIGISAVFMAVLNSRERFFGPAFAPVLFNVGMIVGALGIAPHVNPPIYGLALGVLLGGLCQLLFQLPFLRRSLSYRFRFDPRDEGIKRLLILMLPVVIGLAVVELNLLVDSKLASRLEDGSIAALQYAVRLFQLPLGVIAVALATALLPRLSQQAHPDHRDQFVASLLHGLRLGAFILLPATVGLLVLGSPIIQLLFEHGRFGPEDTTRTLYALRFLAVGLLGYGMTYLLARAFYALQDTRTPVTISAVAVGVNIALDLLLIEPLGIGGLALATAIAGLTQMVLLLTVLERRLQMSLFWQIARPVSRMLVSSCVMGLAVYLVDLPLRSANEFLRVGIGVATGLLSYGVLTFWAQLLPEMRWHRSSSVCSRLELEARAHVRWSRKGEPHEI
jgi:putative peptidoglycan lipid II flippase